MLLLDATNAFATHIRNYLIAATLFATGRTLLQKTDAVAAQFTDSNALRLFFNLNPLWISWGAAFCLLAACFVLGVLNLVCGGLYLLDLAKIPSSQESSFGQRILGLGIITGYILSFAAFIQVLLVLGIVISK